MNMTIYDLVPPFFLYNIALIKSSSDLHRALSAHFALNGQRLDQFRASTTQKIACINKTIGKAFDFKRHFYKVSSATVPPPVHDPPVSGVERSPILASAKF